MPGLEPANRRVPEVNLEILNNGETQLLSFKIVYKSTEIR